MLFYKKYLTAFIFCTLCAGQVSIANAAASLYAEPVGMLQADLDQPSDVAISDDGQAYVLDGVNNRVVVFDKNAQQKFIFGKPQQLNLPMGITIADKRVYVADSGNHRIVIFDLQGRFIRALALPKPKPVPSPSSQFAYGPSEPVALTVNDAIITWSDRRNHRLCRTDANSGKQIHCWGKRGEGKSEFQFPFQLAEDRDGYLHVVDILNARVQVFNTQAQHFINTSRFGLAAGELYRPNGLAIGADGILLVSDVYRATISIFRHGRFVGLLSNKQGERLNITTPTALSVWQDRLYVVESQKNRVTVYHLNTQKMPKADRTNRQQPSTSQKNCVTCHLSWAEDYLSAEGEQEGVVPVATPAMCYSCHHGAIIDSRRSIGRGKQHPDIHHQRKKQSTKKRDDKIPKVFPLLPDKQTDKKQLSCGTCHTPHNQDIEHADTLYRTHANPWLRVLNKDSDLCQQCHDSKIDSSLDKKHPLRGVNHPVGIYLKAPPSPDAKGYAREKELHKGLPKALKNNGATLGSQQQIICQSCHQIHGSDEEALTVLPFTDKDGELCAQCHPRQHSKDQKDARKKGVHPINIKLDKPIKMGKEKITHVTCLSCHSLHAGKQDTPLLKYEYKNGKLCSFCHKEYESVADSDHDLRVTAKESKNHFGDTPEQAGLCGSCHSLHRGKANTAFLYAGKQHDAKAEVNKKFIPERDKLCLNCHRKKGVAEKAAVKHFTHPAKDMVLRSDPKIMPLTDKRSNIKKFGHIACITCHDPHRWAPKTKKQPQSLPRGIKRENRDGNVLNSFLRRKGPKDSFCINCHGLETPVKYKYYHDKLSRDKGADYIK